MHSVRRRKYFYIVLSFIFLSVISSLLYIYYFHLHVLFSSNDMQFHMRRIEELRASITHGNIIPLFSFNYFHGSAVMAMYPYISVLPFVLILIVTHSLLISYYIFSILLIFSSLIISFYSDLHINHSIQTSYLFSLTYSMSSTFTFFIFVDGDLGIATSLIFLPLVICGFINIFQKSGSYFQLTLGMVLLIYCQIPTFVIMFMLLIFWAILNIKYINKCIIILLMKSFLLTVVLTSFIWIPIIHLLFTTNLYTVKNVPLTSTNPKFFVEVLSIIPIVTLILALFYFLKLHLFEKQMYIISIIIIIICSKFMPWHLIVSLPVISFINKFQYTFRFLIIPQIFLCYIFSVIFISCIKNIKIYKYILYGIFILIILLQIISQIILIDKNVLHTYHLESNSYSQMERVSKSNQYRNSHSRFKLTNKSIKYYVNGWFNNVDYIPKQSLSRSDDIYNNYYLVNNKPLGILKHVGYNKFIFDNKCKNNPNRLFLPFVAYNKEKLKLTLNNHHVNYSIHNNIICLHNVKKGFNILKIKYSYNLKLLILELILFIAGTCKFTYDYSINKRRLRGDSLE